MSDLSMFSFTGRLTKDAVFKTINTTGKSVLNFDVAVNTGWGDNKKATFVKVSYWGTAGEKLVNFFTKGTTVAIAGELYTNTWTAKDGTVHTDVCVDAKSLQTIFNNNFSRESDQQEPESDSETPTF